MVNSNMTTGPWVEGDPLTPTNLNARGTGFGTTGVYYVPWASGTGTTQITNAIVNAAALGFNAVLIPKSAFPYNAANVTFNNAIHMLREGGPLDLNVYDPIAYGAGQAGAFDRQGLQAAFDASYVNSKAYKVLPGARDYQIDRPVMLRNPKWQCQTDIGFSIGPTGSFAGGPLLFSQSDDATYGRIPVVTGHGTGNSLDLSAATDNFWLDLRDAKAMDMNGLTTWCVELLVEPSTLMSQGTVISSSGAVSPSDIVVATNKPPRAFRMSFNDLGGGNFGLAAQVTISGTIFQISTLTGFPVNGTLYHVAITYDGTNIRTFVAGALQRTTAAAGSLTMQPQEQVVIGPTARFTPDVTNDADHQRGYYNAVRISNITRYTSGFTPPTTLPSDANTLASLNFATNDGLLTKGFNKDGDIWHWARTAGTSGDALAATDHPTWTGNGIINGADTHIGLLVYHCIYPRIGGLTISGRDGLRFYGESFFGSVEDVNIGAIGTTCRYGLICMNASLQHLRNPTITGYAFPLSVMQAQVDRIFIEAHTETVYAITNMAIDFSSLVLNNPNVDTEGIFGGSTAWLGTILIGASAPAAGTPQNVVVNGGEIDTGKGTAAKAHIVIDGAGHAAFYGTRFTTNAGVPSTMTVRTKSNGVASIPLKPVLFSAPAHAVYPISNITGTAVVLDAQSGGPAVSMTSGTALLPTYGFVSDNSLGWFSSATSTMALSYGTLNLNGGILSSIRTTASSANSATLNDGEIRLAAVSTTSAEIAWRSGNTTYRFIAAATAL
jgi:hypothetical protein